MMIDEDDVTREQTEAETELTRRRDFLTSLRRWSHAVIDGVVLGGFVVAPEAQAGWINSRGRWVKRGDGFSAIRGGSWINGGGVGLTAGPTGSIAAERGSTLEPARSTGAAAPG